MTATVPAVTSVWSRSDGGVSTVTEVTVMHDRTKIAYTTDYPGTDRWRVGMSDVDHFLTHHTEASR